MRTDYDKSLYRRQRTEAAALVATARGTAFGCERCGETDPDVLTVSNMNGRVLPGAGHIFRWVCRNGKDEELAWLRILCANCKMREDAE